MLKGKFVVLSLIAAALVCWQVTGAVNNANSGIVDPCSSSASTAGTCLLVCPAGDGDNANSTLGGSVDGTISVTVADGTGAAIAGVPATDFWLTGCDGFLVLCGGSGSINADSASNSSGNTTISGQLAAGVDCDPTGDAFGGPETGLLVVAQGVVIGGPACSGSCLAMIPRSPDLDGSLGVDLVDFSLFGAAYPPNAYNECADYDCSGANNLVDFSIFGQHYLDVCT